MSLLHKGRPWRSFLQLRQNLSPSPPSLHRPKSAHLGLQQFRTQNSHLPQNGFAMAFHGSTFFLSSPCLHHPFSSPSFSTAAEAANMASSAAEQDTEGSASVQSAEMETESSAAEQDTEGSASVQSAEMETESPVTVQIDLMQEVDKSIPVAATAPVAHQEANISTKMLEEHRQLVNSLRAEMEDQKTLIRSILDDISLLKSQSKMKTSEEKLSTKLPWPEWTAFLEHLRSSDFFNDEKQKPAEGSSVFDDPACVKRAIFKFSQAHESIYESLSKKDLRIIAQYGRAGKDQKAVASQKRLCQHFLIEEDSASCSSAVKPAVIQPKLSDVTRLLYSTVTASQEDALADDVKSSILRVLREIITFSCKTNTAVSPAASDTTESSKQEKGKPLKMEKVREAQKANLGKGECEKTPGKVEARPEVVSRPQQWKCPRCFFMNLDHKHRCVECSRKRPGSTHKSNTEVETTKNTETAFSIDEDLDVKAPVEERKAMKARESLKEKGTLRSLSIQEQASIDAQQSSSEADTSSKGSDSEEHFDILDDILESEDSDDDHKGNERRAALSDLFARKVSTSPLRRDDHQRNDFGRRGGRRPPKGKRYEDEGDNLRPRRGSVGDDEEEGSQEDDEAPPRRSGRGFSNRDDGKSGRGMYNSFRGGGGPRGYGGGRGDSYDDRHSDGGWKGGRSSGDRRDQWEDRGWRSSSYDGRASSRGRGRSRY